MTRRIFIGDVQGCRDALCRLLDAVRFDPPADQLFLTGDLVNKGLDNAATLRLVRRLAARAVLGNHDALLLRLAAGELRRPGSHTLHDVLRADDCDELVAWVATLPPLLHLGDIVLVHAAVRPGWCDLRATALELAARLRDCLARGDSPFDDPDLRFCLSARYCTADGEQADPDWPPPGPPYHNWVDLYRGAETVVFGHFARQGLLLRERIRGLDTGCVYGHELTAWIAEEDRIVAVAADS